MTKEETTFMMKQVLDSLEVWDKLGGKDWTRLLIKYPQFFDIADLDKLDGSDWSWLMIHQPMLFHRIGKSIHRLEGRHWSLILQAKPKLVNIADLSKFSESDWKSLLICRPHLKRYKSSTNNK